MTLIRWAVDDKKPLLAICRGIVELDAPANKDAKGDRVISAAGTGPAAVALTTNEELVVARRAYRLLRAS